VANIGCAGPAALDQTDRSGAGCDETLDRGVRAR
jgi:hypothetical protein